LSGTPVVYYGDEIGMGDNIYLGDRNGVRTPMQWSGGWTGGFSLADPERLYSPVVSNITYCPQAVNVLSEQRSAHSLLSWMKRLIRTRKSSRAFGSGTIEFLHPPNHRVLAYVRRFGNETILVVNNLSASAQAVEIDLKRFRGAIPVEMAGGSIFPRIGDLPYLLTLAAYQFFWFKLRRM
jgi:maltose alpha-D-glucosyltransferase/alpha-amylase